MCMVVDDEELDFLFVQEMEILEFINELDIVEVFEVLDVSELFMEVQELNEGLFLQVCEIWDVFEIELSGECLVIELFDSGLDSLELLGGGLLDLFVDQLFDIDLDLL